jgi:hypothetical protein
MSALQAHLSFENLGRAQSSLLNCVENYRSTRRSRSVTVVILSDWKWRIRLEPEPLRSDVVRFVSILSKAGRDKISLPIALPQSGEWFVRIIGSKNRLVFGVYRRHMKTIGYLGQIDKLFGAPATTRSWNTILSVLRILKAQATNAPGGRPTKKRET